MCSVLHRQHTATTRAQVCLDCVRAACVRVCACLLRISDSACKNFRGYLSPTISSRNVVVVWLSPINPGTERSKCKQALQKYRPARRMFRSVHVRNDNAYRPFWGEGIMCIAYKGQCIPRTRRTQTQNQLLRRQHATKHISFGSWNEDLVCV